MLFEEELNRILPAGIPQRSRLIELSAKHLFLIEETNKVMNLSRIVNAREAAIKHVLDSVWPWRYFAKTGTVLDIGTGAGFPGIPLAIVLPEVQFVLADSTQKKARFVELAVQSLALANVTIRAERGEALFKSDNFDIATGRAVAPLSRLVPLLAPGLKGAKTALLYKGPDAETEITEARGEVQKRHLQMKLLERYRLPEDFGERTLVQIAKQSR